MKFIPSLSLLTPLFFSFSMNAFCVTTEAQLEASIKDANNGRVSEIQFRSDVEYSSSLYPLNVNRDFSPAGQSILIEGNGHTLKASSPDARGFFYINQQQDGTLTIKNLTLDSSSAKGGDAYDGGGGGGGLGGGLFLGKDSNVVLDNVHFINCSAEGGSSLGEPSPEMMNGGGGGGLGGNGGKAHPTSFGAGGGGGLFGNGGDAGSFSGGGGGGFLEDGTSGSKAHGGDGGNSSPETGYGLGGTIDHYGNNGSSGSGGGGCGRFDESGTYGGKGGFGGGGGGDSFSGRGGDGNFGGGGGGGGHGYNKNFNGGDGGNGGFGGGGGAGGGNNYGSEGGAGGSGGFGGGGGAGAIIDGVGGLGYFGGRGENEGGLGGGGAALGGAIFLQSGAHLYVKNTISFENSRLKGGSGFEAGDAKGTDIFMESGSLITLDLSKDSTLTTSIVGNHSKELHRNTGIIKRGPATLTLVGNQSFQGTADIYEGAFILHGSITAPVNIYKGSFGGKTRLQRNKHTGTKGSLHNIGGTLTNEYGPIHVEGDYIQESGASYTFSLDHSDNMLKIDGKAYLGGSIEIPNFTKDIKANDRFPVLFAEQGVQHRFDVHNIPLTSYQTPLLLPEYTKKGLTFVAQPYELSGNVTNANGNILITDDYTQEPDATYTYYLDHPDKKISATGPISLNGPLIVLDSKDRFSPGTPITIVKSETGLEGKFSHIQVPMTSYNSPLFTYEQTETEFRLIAQPYLLTGDITNTRGKYPCQL